MSIIIVVDDAVDLFSLIIVLVARARIAMKNKYTEIVYIYRWWIFRSIETNDFDDGFGIIHPIQLTGGRGGGMMMLVVGMVVGFR